VWGPQPTAAARNAAAKAQAGPTGVDPTVAGDPDALLADAARERPADAARERPADQVGSERAASTLGIDAPAAPGPSIAKAIAPLLGAALVLILIAAGFATRGQLRRVD
jgi:hypothetical protein